MTHTPTTVDDGTDLSALVAAELKQALREEIQIGQNIDLRQKSALVDRVAARVASVVGSQIKRDFSLLSFGELDQAAESLNTSGVHAPHLESSARAGSWIDVLSTPPADRQAAGVRSRRGNVGAAVAPSQLPLATPERPQGKRRRVSVAGLASAPCGSTPRARQAWGQTGVTACRSVVCSAAGMLRSFALEQSVWARPSPWLQLNTPLAAEIVRHLPFIDKVRLATVFRGMGQVLLLGIAWDPLVLSRRESSLLFRRLKTHNVLGLCFSLEHPRFGGSPPVPLGVFQTSELRLELMGPDRVGDEEGRHPLGVLQAAAGASKVLEESSISRATGKDAWSIGGLPTHATEGHRVLDPLGQLCRHLQFDFGVLLQRIEITNIEDHCMDCRFLHLRCSVLAHFPFVRLCQESQDVLANSAVVDDGVAAAGAWPIDPHHAHCPSVAMHGPSLLTAGPASTTYVLVAARGPGVLPLPQPAGFGKCLPSDEALAAVAASARRQPPVGTQQTLGFGFGSWAFEPPGLINEAEALFLAEHTAVFKAGDTFHVAHAPWRTFPGPLVRRRYRALLAAAASISTVAL